MDMTRLLFEFSNTCSEEIPHITWLLLRLGRDALFRALSARKRSRGEGGSA